MTIHDSPTSYTLAHIATLIQAHKDHIARTDIPLPNRQPSTAILAALEKIVLDHPTKIQRHRAPSCPRNLQPDKTFSAPLKPK